MMWTGYGMNGWGMALMAVSQLLFWALLIGAGVLLYRAVTKPDAASNADTPTRMLAERYARGEIDEDEYQRRLATLRHT